MRCLAMRCRNCCCCWEMAGNWNVVIMVPLWQLWCHQCQLSCSHTTNPMTTSSSHCSSLADCRDCDYSTRMMLTIMLWRCFCVNLHRKLHCYYSVAAETFYVFDCSLWYYCCCRFDCSSSCWLLGNCSHQDLNNTKKQKHIVIKHWVMSIKIYLLSVW
jgi:hypothetical protein